MIIENINHFEKVIIQNIPTYKWYSHGGSHGQLGTPLIAPNYHNLSANQRKDVSVFYVLFHVGSGAILLIEKFPCKFACGLQIWILGWKREQISPWILGNNHGILLQIRYFVKVDVNIPVNGYIHRSSWSVVILMSEIKKESSRMTPSNMRLLHWIS